MEAVQSQLFDSAALVTSGARNSDTPHNHGVSRNTDTPQSLKSHLNLLRQELHKLYRDRERYADEIDELSSEIESIQEELWNLSGVYA